MSFALNSYRYAVAAGVSTSYANTGGTGDRTAIITVTGNAIGGAGGSAWVNGNTADTLSWFNNGAVDSSDFIRFDFGSGASKVIDEVTFYQERNDTTHGVWKWQGSNDGSSWTDIGSSFTLGQLGTTTQVITAMAGNTTGYRYYQFCGVSGSASSSPWIYEFEFKIG